MVFLKCRNCQFKCQCNVFMPNIEGVFILGYKSFYVHIFSGVFAFFFLIFPLILCFTISSLCKCLCLYSLEDLLDQRANDFCSQGFKSVLFCYAALWCQLLSYHSTSMTGIDEDVFFTRPKHVVRYKNWLFPLKLPVKLSKNELLCSVRNK